MKKLLILTAVLIFISTSVGCNCFPRLFRRGAAYEPWGTSYSPACCSPCGDVCGPATISAGSGELGPIPGI